MTTITLINDYVWVYLVLIFISGYFMFRVKKEFSTEDLLNYFIYITTKINAYIIFSTSILLLIGVMSNFSEIKINTFRQEIFYIMVFYSVVNYGVYYLLKLINYYIQIYKKSDLTKFGLENLNKGGKQ